MPNTSKPSPSGWPCATRDTENVPAAPLPNRAVNTAASSFRTGPAWPVTCGPAVPDRAGRGHRPPGHRGAHHGPADHGDRPAQLLGDVHQVTAQVGQRAGAGATLIPPAQRGGRVQRVVLPVPPAELDDLAEFRGGQQLADRADGRRPAVGVADGGDQPGRFGGGRHGLRVGVRGGQWLLAQHVLARGQQALGHLPVQVVRGGHADRVHVRCRRHRLPAGFGPLVAVAAGYVLGQCAVGVGHRDQPDRGPVQAVQGGRGAVGRGVRPAGHARADHGHANGSRAGHSALVSHRRWAGLSSRPGCACPSRAR